MNTLTVAHENRGNVFGLISPIWPSQLDRQETDALVYVECFLNLYNFDY